MTAYQLSGVVNPDRHLRQKYTKDANFRLHEVTVGDRTGALLEGAKPVENARWADTVGYWVGDPDLSIVGNVTPGAVLLLPGRNAVNTTWALCFGLGFQMVEPKYVVNGLGRRLAVRCADPQKVRSITHARLDARAFVSRTSIPGGDVLAAYGVAELGDLVSRIVGPALLSGMHADAVAARPVEIRGADAIKLPLARHPTLLLSDLDAVEELLGREPLRELELIEQVRIVKTSEPVHDQLHAALDDALGQQEPQRLGLAWPNEFADVAVPIDFFRIAGAPRGHSGDQPRPPGLDALLEPLRHMAPGRRADRLATMRVQAFTDEDEPASNLLPAKRWLVFETNVDGHRYCLHDGHWYELDRGLTERVSSRVREVFDRPSSVGSLPDWDAADTTEAEYNTRLAVALGGVSMDARLVRCDTHPRGFEACDVLTAQGVFLHVKKVDRSAPPATCSPRPRYR